MDWTLCENKAKQTQFQDIGLDAVWIPAFAGMTNLEFLYD